MGRYLSAVFVLTEFLYIFQNIYSKFCDSKSRYRYVQYYLSPIDDKCRYFTSTTVFGGNSPSRSSKRITVINLKPDSNPGNSEGRKFKIITPNDIGKIFETSQNSEGGDDDDEDDDYDEFDESDDPLDIVNQESLVEGEADYSVIDISKSSPLQKQRTTDFKDDEIVELVVPTLVTEVDFVPNSKDTQIMNELQALYSMSGMVELAEEPIKVKPQNETPDDLDYAGLDRTLDKSAFRAVKESISVKPSSLSSSSSNPSESALRTFRYDPTLLKRGDPMLYGAYRRWKEVEINGASTGTDTKKKSGPGGKGKKNPKNAADKFYDALKKLGSGPADKGSSSQTGIAEPPPNSKPIQPKKAPAKKNKKKIITPDDIDSLFKKPPPPSSADPTELSSSSDRGRGKDQDDDNEDDDISDDDDDDDDEDEDDSSDLKEVTKTESYTTVSSGNSNANALDRKSSTLSAFNSYIGTDDGVPQWLQQAEAETKKKKAAKRNAKKMKKLTDDWRFWAAIIVSVGFASAFYNVYQQTGGFGGAENAFPFGSSGSSETVGEIVI